MNPADDLATAAQRWPQHPALIFQNQPFSFSTVQEQAGRWAGALLERGIASGARVALLLPNAPEFAYGYFAVAAVQGVFAPLDPSLKPDELRHILADLAPALLISTPELAPQLRAACAELASAPPLLTTDALNVAPAARFSPQPVTPDDTAVILYTSGTVGGPKGVALSHAAMSESPDAMITVYGLAPGQVYGLAVPMSHISGPLLLSISVRSGATLLLFDRFHPQRFLEQAQRHGMTTTHMVPPMLHALLQVHEHARFDLSRVRYLCTFGMTASAEMLHQFHARYPHIGLSSGYGLTETGPLVTLGPACFPPAKFGAVGQRTRYAGIRIVDDTGADVPPGESGEVWLSGPSLMQGYWHRPEFTQQMMPDAWFRTGDIGLFDPDEYLWIQGRKKDVINVAGLKVYAPEVEDAIYKHPGVAEVAVIGVTGGLKGEAVRAVVVPKAGATLAPEDITAHCRVVLADYKVPRQVVIRTEPLPRSRTGKIAKESLRD